ncbi:MAG: hypothetical protein KIS92_00990 [Planctomycetota bacterium]|nr:hypothetical protein [Planctomycetota bacterium]
MDDLQKEFAQRDLERLLEYWQRALRLQDWKISVAFTNHGNLKEGDFGEVDWCANHKMARIKLVNHDTLPEALNFIPPPSSEETLVHELLHLHFAPYAKREESEGVKLEIAINCIAGALVSERLKRERKEAENAPY